MSVTTEITNPNSVVGEEMSFKKRQTEEFKKSLSDESKAKLEKLLRKPKGEDSDSKEMNTNIVTEDTSNEESEIVDSSLVTVESKNPKYDEFKSKLTPLFEDSKQIVEEIYSKTVRLTYNYIQIGNVLTESKENLSKDDYEKLIGNFDIDVRTAYRYIKLVKNDNVSKLTMDDMKSMINPSIGKLVKMHSLSDEEFEEVLCGNDQPLLSDNSGNDNVYPLSDRIDNKTYDNLKKMTKIEIMKFFLDDVDKLKSQIKTVGNDNEVLFELISVNNLSFETNKKVS